MYAQEYVIGYPVKLTVLTIVKTHLPTQLVGLLVIQLSQRVHHVQRVAPTWNLAAHAARTDQYQNRVLTLGDHAHQLIHAHRITLAQHTVFLVKRTHAFLLPAVFKVVPVHYIVIQHLVIRQRLVVDTDAFYRQIGTGGVKLQLALDVEIHLVQPFGGRRFLAVHIKADERPLLVRLRDRIEHVSDPDVLARLELRSHRVLITDHLSGVHRLGHHARQELRLLGGHYQAIPVAVRQFTQAGNQFGFGVRHVVGRVFDLQRHAHVTDAVADRLVRLVEGTVAAIGRKRHAGTVAKQQAVFVPARTRAVLVHAPKHVFKHHVFVTAYPGSGVVLRITTPKGIERTDRVW